MQSAIVKSLNIKKKNLDLALIDRNINSMNISNTQKYNHLQIKQL